MTNITIAIDTTRTAPLPHRYVGFRGLHYVTENGRPTEWVGAPAIIPAYTDGSVILTEEIQWMSFELMSVFCPGMTKERWRVMHGSSLAMCNKTGLTDPDNPRRDYINNLDMGAELPRYDKIRTFQGSFIRGTLNGNLITCTPGVDAIDANKTMPTIAQIISHHWYSVAINTGKTPFHFRPTWGGVIVYPFIMRSEMSYLAEFFARWDADDYPEPLRTYNPV